MFRQIDFCSPIDLFRALLFGQLFHMYESWTGTVAALEDAKVIAAHTVCSIGRQFLGHSQY